MSGSFYSVAVLRAIGHPASFLGLLTGFLVAVVIQGWAQMLVARALGDRWATRNAGDVKRRFDPFGAVAAIISGPGWGALPSIVERPKWRRVVALLAGPAAAFGVGVAFLGGFIAAGGPQFLLPGRGIAEVISGINGPSNQVFLLCAGLEAIAVAVLSFIPLPPLMGWRIVQMVAPRSVGWQKTEYWLQDRNIGVVALLALLLLPLGGGSPLFVAVVDDVSGGLLTLIFSQ